MSLLRPTSIRQRLLLISGTVSFVTLAVVGALFVVNDVQMLRGQMARDLEVLSDVIGENCRSALVFDVPETAERNLATLQHERQISYAALYDAENRLFARYVRPGVPSPGEPILEGGGVVMNVSLLGIGAIEVTRLLEFDGRPIGRIFIRAHTDELARQLRRYAGMAALLLLVALVASLLLALPLQRQVSGPILHLASRTREVSKAENYALRVPDPDFEDEIAELYRGFNGMLAQIEVRNRRLRAIGADLEGANAKLRRLAKEISAVETQEKKRLARELHDSPMQKLALAQMQIGSAARRRDKESEQLLAAGLELMREALRELRTLQFELSPPVLEQAGLGPALQWLAAATEQRFGIAFTYIETDALPVLDREHVTLLFQSARELVYNVIKHAEATRAELELAFGDDAVTLSVRDDGKGFDPDRVMPRPESGYGLFNTRERLLLWGGRLAVESDRSGTRVTATLPLGSSRVDEPGGNDADAATEKHAQEGARE